MSKYHPLNSFLQSQSREKVPMTFAEIERLLKVKLPPSKTNRAWWSNNPSNNVMTREWLSAGYVTESVDISGETLVFRRTKKTASSGAAGRAGKGAETTRPLHPGFGFMGGLITVAPGFDVTGPFDETPWDAGYLGEYDASSASSRKGGS